MAGAGKAKPRHDLGHVAGQRGDPRGIFGQRVVAEDVAVILHRGAAARGGDDDGIQPARVDLARIPDPEAWLTNRLGPLASFEMRPIVGADIDAPDANQGLPWLIRPGFRGIPEPLVIL